MPDLGKELSTLATTANPPAIAVADRLIQGAIAAQASDVHVDPAPDEWVVRFRLDGVLHQVARIPRGAVPTLVARLKVLADLPTYIVDAAQDGRIPRDRVKAPQDLRLSVVPTIHGEKAVLRLFDPSARLLQLHELGLSADAARALERAVLSPRGIVVLAGPAGSGKSTTIHSAILLIQERSKGRRSIVGVEDPVERTIPGVTQTQVNQASGFGFEQALRALLRQDPEVIYLGEVRDAATAAVAIEAGLTGHLVITTVHSGSCAQAFARFLEMGLEPHLVTSALSVVFAQRLVRRLCDACAEPDPEALARLSTRLGADAKPRRAKGCDRCQTTGYKGRAPIVEHALLSANVRKAILARAEEETLAAELRKDGLRSLEENGLALVASGATSLEEVERVLGVIA